MKVYFISTPRGKSELESNYKKIFELTEKLGHKHVTDFIIDVQAEKFYLSDISRFYKKTVADLKRADVCVFEVTSHSLAIGQLISIAVEQGKPIIALHTQGHKPFFLSGLEDEKVQIIEYSTDNLVNVLEAAFDYAADQQDTRFNFFISPKHQNFLDWISKTKKIPRAVFLRNLIEEEMEKDEEYTA